MREEIRDWWEQSKNDFNAAKDSLKTKHFDWACFQMQQSIEKALKAVLMIKENKLIKSHDLVFLANKVNLPLEFKEICKELTLMYLPVRYPDSAEIKDIQKKAERYVKYVEEILKWTKELL